MVHAESPASSPPVRAPAAKRRADRHNSPLSLAQQRFLLILLLMGAVLGAVASVAIFKPDAAIQTAIFTVLGTGFLGPLKDAFRHYFPGGEADKAAAAAK